jgi:hypothetical protein
VNWIKKRRAEKVLATAEAARIERQRREQELIDARWDEFWFAMNTEEAS